jgi:hypothetical protein
MNSYTSDPSTIPGHRIWKNIVKDTIALKESELWDRRMCNDGDFTFYRILHPVIQPAKVYKIFKESKNRHVMKTIVNLWCREPIFQNDICPLCGDDIIEEMTHILADCKTNEILRNCLTHDIKNQFELILSNELSRLDGIAWTLKILGAPIPPLIDSNIEETFFAMTYKYIYKCLENL